MCAEGFVQDDIDDIEHELLDILDFKLAITEDDLLLHHKAIMSRYISSQEPLPGPLLPTKGWRSAGLLTTFLVILNNVHPVLAPRL